MAYIFHNLQDNKTPWVKGGGKAYKIKVKYTKGKHHVSVSIFRTHAQNEDIMLWI